jgi:predicted lipoprotein with Yx(FWY)xxD motif
MNQIFRFRMLGAFAGLLCGAIACGDSSSDGGAAIKLATNARVGNHLVDGKGRSLYYFGKDVPASGSNAAVSNCSGECAAAWPAFHASNAVVQGIVASDVGEITGSDGSTQTTYRGWPLYFFSGDAKAGDINGEGIDSIWFVLRDEPYSVALMSNAAGQQPELYLSDGTGRSLYSFSQDTTGTATTDPVSACSSAGCLANWPIFVSAEVVVPSALAISDFTVFTRPDGQKQSAYKGHPLYFFAGDGTAGETNGRGVNSRDTVDPRNVP